MTGPEVVVEGILYPEGLAWDDAGHGLVCTSVQRGAVYRVDLERAVARLVAETGGGANNVVPADGGGWLVAQNGGIDAVPFLTPHFPEVAEWPGVTHVAPGLQLVAADGCVHDVVREGFNAPNDLVVGEDGTLYVTDPGHPSAAGEARIMALQADGTLRVVASGFRYCNGIDVDGGTLLVADVDEIVRLEPDGTRVASWRWPFDVAPDGLTVDGDGRVFVAAGRRSAVAVLDGGRLVEMFEIPGGGQTTNCCIGERGELFATDARAGSILVWPAIRATRRPAHRWAVT